MTILIAIYCICAVWLTLYGINCFILTRLHRHNDLTCSRKHKRLLDQFYSHRPPENGFLTLGEKLPVVTTQLPIYNERNVVERLINAVAAFKYPAGRHEIQVLDDSTDETSQIIARKVASLQKTGVDIKHIRRRDRRGFKAGALRHGLKTCRGAFNAIFDADFVPPPDFLLKAIPHFLEDRRVGFVQGRWSHLNRNQNLITRLQSIGINGHFMIEQSARYGAGLCLNFNGTAGIFCKQAILEAGNWQDDTLTEDMDLSYRIQLNGWSCRYIRDLAAPAEIPADINAFKNQQFRWAKGSIQTAVKLLPRILTSSMRPFVKVQAVLHLTHYVTHPLMLFLALAATPILLQGGIFLPPLAFLLFGAILLLSCSGPSYMYVTAERELGGRLATILPLLPIMICFGCGLALNNTRAVAEALLGIRSSFVRTPKRGDRGLKNYMPNRSILFLLEMLMGLWCWGGVILFFSANHYLVGQFLLAYGTGFSAIGLLSWHHRRQA